MKFGVPTSILYRMYDFPYCLDCCTSLFNLCVCECEISECMRPLALNVNIQNIKCFRHNDSASAKTVHETEGIPDKNELCGPK